MRYATWEIDFTENAEQGLVPYEFMGVFYLTENKIAGYIPEDAVLTDYLRFNVAEISAEEMLALSESVNPEATMVNGKIITPPPSVSIPS